MFQKRVTAMIGMVVLASVVGCSGSGIDVETVEVSGTVTHNGATLGNVTLIFTPASGRTGTAVVGADGKFSEATTFAAGDGLVVGDHTVSASASSTASDAEITSSDEYSTDSSVKVFPQATVTITSGQSTPLEIKLAD